MEFIGIDGSVPFFAHGQTYVAASRVKTSDPIAFYHPAATHVSCLNVVYHSFITQTMITSPPVRSRRPNPSPRDSMKRPRQGGSAAPPMP
eukprot:1638524-Rhodomonas_salina.1